jgi:Ca2+-binding RTX toxin-like protein
VKFVGESLDLGTTALTKNRAFIKPSKCRGAKNMATIAGTGSADTLKGTTGNDDIQGLGGNDRIIGSIGFDTVDGGAGNDTIDFTNLNLNLFAGFSSFGLSGYNISDRPGSGGGPGPVDFGTLGTRLTNVETIVGNPNQSNTIKESFTRAGSALIGTYDIDLSKNRVTLSSSLFSYSQTFTVKNFDNIDLVFGGHRLAGNNRDNKISAEDSVIIGSKGNDTLSGINNTLDYSNLGHAVKFSPSGSIDKSGFGKDKISGFKKIIGATNKSNTIDASTADSGSSLDVNLANNSLQVNSPNTSPLQIEVLNFVNVIGSVNNDSIVGADVNSKLTGGGGNDTICGGSKNDRIIGTDSTARGVGEVDTLTGGGGRDKFILGDKNGAYYLGNGSNDYATITDFNIFQDSIDLGILKNYSFAFEGTNTIDLYSGKDVNTRDLIAKIQIAGGISSVASNSRSIAGSSPNLDSIISKIDVLSGAASSDS